MSTGVTQTQYQTSSLAAKNSKGESKDGVSALLAAAAADDVIIIPSLEVIPIIQQVY